MFKLINLMKILFTFIGSISIVAIYNNKWKSLIDSWNCNGVNCLKYLDNESKSWICPSISLFSTGNFMKSLFDVNVLSGVNGVEAGTSSNKYSTGNGRANLDTSLP